ncbi:ROK family protein [Streptomyces sp. NPDC048179]|uniref:ROK family protein n=1 Tax=Streptomyces sp. NPDC048179 TaxID=3365506 RepID=UPI00371D7CCE
MSARDEVLAHVRRHGSASRPELQTALGISRPVVAAVVRDLLAGELLTEHRGENTGGRGRPGRRLRPRYPAGAVVGVDVGHRHLTVAAATLDLTVRAERRVAIDVDTRPTAALDITADMIRRTVEEVRPMVDGPVNACVVGIPGPLDMSKRAIASPTILSSWSGLDLAAELGSRTGLTVSLDNDANLGALAEHRHGAADHRGNLIYVKASDGIGAGLIVHGIPVSGSFGAAGEIGHTQVIPDGDWCRCGNRGCLETIVSVRQVLQQVRHFYPGDADLRSRLPEIAHHPVARKIFAESGRTLGRVLANLCALLDPAAVVIGGEMGQAGEAFVDGVRDSIERLAQPGFDNRVLVVASALGTRAELIGSLTLARDIALRGVLRQEVAQRR